MNYQAHYYKLTERARERVLTIYTEEHHIIPLCMGGSDEKLNIVRLTAEEHFVAHQLLVKMYPKSYDLAFAASGMTASPRGNGKRNNNKRFGWLKRRQAEAARIARTGKKASENTLVKMRGRKHSNESRAKHSLSILGEKNHLFGKTGDKHPFFGKHHSVESRTSISAGQLGEKNHMFGKIGNQSPTFGKKASNETRAKLSAYRKGKKASSETRAKQSVAAKGRKHSDESRAKRSASMKGRKFTPEHCAALSKAWDKRRAKKNE